MLSANGTKAILFDFDGTLRHNLPPGGEVFTDYAASLGLSLTEEDRRRAAIWEHYYFASSPEIEADRRKFNGNEDGFWYNFGYRRLKTLGCPASLIDEISPKVTTYMRENYRPQARLPEETFDVLTRLKETGLTIGIVSNRDKPYKDEIEELGLQDYIHFSLAGGEVKSWKPDPKIFKHAVKMAKTKSEYAIYVGDNYFADVVGARDAGLQPVLYNPKGLFLEPDCPVISSFTQLIGLIES